MSSTAAGCEGAGGTSSHGINGARVFGIDRLTGSIEVGKRADLMVLDLTQPEMQPQHDPISHIVY